MDGLISSGSGKSTEIQFQIRSLSITERRQIALRAVGICWLLSALSIPLPPIHWVTVPFFFFFGIYRFFKKIREPEHFVPFTSKCPECGKPLEIGGRVFETPLQIVCPHCRFNLKLTLEAP